MTSRESLQALIDLRFGNGTVDNASSIARDAKAALLNDDAVSQLDLKDGVPDGKTTIGTLMAKMEDIGHNGFEVKMLGFSMGLKGFETMTIARIALAGQKPDRVVDIKNFANNELPGLIAHVADGKGNINQATLTAFLNEKMAPPALPPVQLAPPVVTRITPGTKPVDVELPHHDNDVPAPKPPKPPAVATVPGDTKPAQVAVRPPLPAAAVPGVYTTDDLNQLAKKVATWEGTQDLISQLKEKGVQLAADFDASRGAEKLILLATQNGIRTGQTPPVPGKPSGIAIA